MVTLLVNLACRYVPNVTKNLDAQHRAVDAAQQSIEAEELTHIHGQSGDAGRYGPGILVIKYEGMDALCARTQVWTEFRPDVVKLKNGQLDELLTAYESRVRAPKATLAVAFKDLFRQPLASVQEPVRRCIVS
jgi:hypothetical protein